MVNIEIFMNDGKKIAGRLGNKYMNGIDLTDDKTNEVLFIPLTSFRYYRIEPEVKTISKPSTGATAW